MANSHGHGRNDGHGSNIVPSWLSRIGGGLIVGSVLVFAALATLTGPHHHHEKEYVMVNFLLGGGLVGLGMYVPRRWNNIQNQIAGAMCSGFGMLLLYVALHGVFEHAVPDTKEGWETALLIGALIRPLVWGTRTFWHWATWAWPGLRTFGRWCGRQLRHFGAWARPYARAIRDQTADWLGH